MSQPSCPCPKCLNCCCREVEGLALDRVCVNSDDGFCNCHTAELAKMNDALRAYVRFAGILDLMPESLGPLMKLALLRAAQFKLGTNLPESVAEWALFHMEQAHLVDFVARILTENHPFR